MKKHLFTFFAGWAAAAIFVCLVAGCASSSVLSHKTDRLKGPYTKIFIAIQSNYRTGPFTGPLMDSIAREFGRRNIVLGTYDIPETGDNLVPTEPDSINAELNAAINEFKPRAVMLITTKTIVLYRSVQEDGAGSNGGTFVIRLFDPADFHTPMWTAKMHVFGNMGIAAAVRKGSRSFISTLEDDNIIPRQPQ
jgi:hypothetical protein